MAATHNASPISDTYNTFVEGQVVKLVLGGPDLVVIDVCDDCGEVEVAWIDSDQDISFGSFPTDALRSVQ